MPISKKDRIHREHKKAEAAGTRVPVHANGTPVKKPKATSICAFCKKELVSLLELCLSLTRILSDTSYYRLVPTLPFSSSTLPPTPTSGPRRSAGPTSSSEPLFKTTPPQPLPEQAPSSSRPSNAPNSTQKSATDARSWNNCAPLHSLPSS